MNINNYSKTNFCSQKVNNANLKRINHSFVLPAINEDSFVSNKELSNRSENWFRKKYSELLETLDIERNVTKLKQIVDLALKDNGFVNELLACKVGKTDTDNTFFRDMALIEQLEGKERNPKLEETRAFDRVKDEYSITDMEALVEAKSIDEDLTRELMSQTVKVEIKRQKRFVPEQIKKLVILSQTDKDFAREVINSCENDSYRLNYPAIQAVLNNLPNNKELMKEIVSKKNDAKSSCLFNKYEYDSADVHNLALAAEIDAEFTKVLMHIYQQDYGRMHISRRFKSQDILSLVSFAKYDKQLVTDLINASFYDKNARAYVPLYYPEDISWLISTLKIDKTMTKKLLGFEKGSTIPKKTFSAYKIESIVKFSHKNNVSIIDKIEVACKKMQEKGCEEQDVKDTLVALTNDLTMFEDKNLILNNLLNDADCSEKSIAAILRAVKPENLDLTLQLSHYKDFPKDDIALLLNLWETEHKDFINILVENKEVPVNKILDIVKATVIKDADNVGGNNGKVDILKRDRYIRLLQNPKLSKWVQKMLKKGFDIETITKLAPTKQNALSEKTLKQPQNRKIDLNNKFQDLNLNPLLAKNLETLNQISGADCVTKYNSNVRKQLKQLIGQLPDSTKKSLKEQGVDVDAILGKLDFKIVRKSSKMPNKAKIQLGFRPKSKIKGFERIVVDKYEPIEKVWRSEEATKAWAEEKYLAMRDCEYISTRNTKDDPRQAEKVTQKRKEILAEWYNFMETDDEIKDNPFIRVILCDFITKGLTPERSTLPPVLNKKIIKQILGEASNYSNFSINNSYAKKMKEFSAKNSLEETVEINGIKGTWYTVPKTDSSSPDFKSNVAKIKSFSDGTNWCIRTWRAEPYVQKGNMHFFVDKNGITQICIREEGNPGEVYEIQKRQQDQSAPVAYIDVIQSFMQEHNLTPQEHCKKEFEKTLEQKPEYDKLKSELDALKEKRDYKSILEKMGITVITLPDNTFELSHYSSYINKIALNDLGINENKLLANVSKIKGDADFSDSNATTLPMLKEVGGELNFGYANISNVKNLKSIGGKEIEWK